MNEPSANPVWVTLICVARCVIPLLVLIGASYVIKKLGLVAEPPKPPSQATNETNNTVEGGLIHGSA
jgi:hypothetical protein